MSDLFENEKIDHLYEKIEILLHDREKNKDTIKEVWNALREETRKELKELDTWMKENKPWLEALCGELENIRRGQNDHR
jgi:predicted transcriptional regulator YheO